MEPTRILRTLVAAVLSACAACTLILDHNSTQCHSDADCAHFGDHPFCRSGACAPSGLGPANCFYGSPRRPSDFLNQCGTAQCLSFDNCQRLGLCGDAGFDAALVTPPAAVTPTSSGSRGGGDGGVAMSSCVDPNDGRPRIIVATGSSNFPPLLAQLTPLLLATGYTPVYQVTNSCSAVKSIFGSPSDHVIVDPAPGSSGKYAAYFRQDGTSVPCLLGPDGAQVDVGESDIFAASCSGFGGPTDSVGEYFGPIQSMAIVVPGRSQQTAITAEAARAVFGMGGDNDAATPWTDPTLYFVRNGNTGTQQMIGRAINVPASAFWGTDRGSAANVDALLRVISDPSLANQAIGIISMDYYDNDRANLKALAFKATGQDCAYLPDSTQFKKDKRNVRDGHYPIWGPLHFYAAVSSGIPVSAGAQAFVSVVTVPDLPKALLDASIAASLVPTCAMTVQRSSELGALSAYAPSFQCGCYFEANPNVNGVPPPGCTPCRTASDCANPARPACNLGYCEVQ